MMFGGQAFMNPLKIGVIGYGNRGRSLTKSVLLKSPQFEVVAVCDEYEDRAQRGITDVEAVGGAAPFVSTDYRDILAHGGLDAKKDALGESYKTAKELLFKFNDYLKNHYMR